MSDNKKPLNGTSYNKNGWKYVSIWGSPKERGFAHGYLCAKEFREVHHILEFLMMEAYGQDWKFFIDEISKDFLNMTKTKFKEYYDEMEGITNGVNSACVRENIQFKTDISEILAWNFYCSIPYWYSTRSESHTPREGGGAQDHCSAFMAVGKDWTKDGKIVCAHNSFVNYIDGQLSNVILDIRPNEGHRIIMQTAPCMIWSGTDFFVTSKGIIGTETTIGGFTKYEMNIPICYRIRNAMQYGNTLDEYCKMLLDGNSGDYANSWLFGDTNTNEILRIELGLKFHNIERTNNGYFIGFNAPYDERIRNLEVQNSGFYDIRRHQGARMVRLSDLMDKHKGKIDIRIAREIIADHYDVYLEKTNNPCSRTICAHYDLDDRKYMSQSDRPKPYAPRGAVDGIVCDTKMAKHMSILARYGSSCGMSFKAKEFCKKHRQYEKFCPYLKDRLSQPWTVFKSANMNINAFRKNKYNKNNHKTKKKM